MNTYTESKKKIEETRNWYGEFVFRGAISHLMDVGSRHLTKENVEKDCKQIMESDDTGCFITNEFACEIVQAAYDLAQVSQVDLLAYIQREMVYDIFDGVNSYQRAIYLLKSSLEYIENYNNCNNAENYDAFHDIGLDDDEIGSLGFGYLIPDDDEYELVFVNNRYSPDDPGFDEYDIKERK